MNTNDKSHESKTERFHRLAEKRVNNVMNAIRLLSQCSNRRTYDYTDMNVQRMFREIEGELRAAKKAFHSQDNKKGFKF